MKDREIVAAIAAGDPAGLAGAYDKYAEPRNQCHRRLRAGQAGPGEAAGLAAPPAGGGGDTERAERRGLVRAAMDALNPGEREIIELGFRHDLSGADLAAVLGVSRNQAHALASRAQGRLERELGVLLVARTGRWACPALELMLYDWDGQLTAPMRKQVARHAGDRKSTRLNSS